MQVASLSSSIDFTVIVAVPGFIAFTKPSLVTVAIDSSLLVHFTSLFVDSFGNTIAFSLKEVPSYNSILEVFIFISVILITGAL